MRKRAPSTSVGRLVTLAVVVSQLAGGASGVAPHSSTPAARPGDTETNLICRTCEPPDPEPSPRPTPPPPRPPLSTIMSRYTPYDINADGRTEINWLRPLFPNPEPYATASNGVVIVLVDPRLVTDDPDAGLSRLQMSLWLGLLGSDMTHDGYYPYFVEASVYDGPVHQDGRTLLALRRFLREVRTHYPLAGVLLVGSFPDAALVRSVMVKEHADAADPVSFAGGVQPVSGYVGDYLNMGAEFVTPRAEIVLGDLDGNWESLYRPSLNVTTYRALPLEPPAEYPRNGQYIYTPHFQATSSSFTDVFYIQDHAVTTTAPGNGWLIMSIASIEEPSPEVSAADQELPNRIARPEILVSRIDPRRVAVKPVAPADLDGKTSPLGPDGRPQTLRYDSPFVQVAWYRDAALERRLVADYIARSHRFRLGNDDGLPFRTSAVRALDSGLLDPTQFNARLSRAADDFEPSTTREATLADYVEWLKEPAVLRGIAAHSDAVKSVFAASPDAHALALATGADDGSGNRVWRWAGAPSGSSWVLTPSFDGLTTDANFHVYRTLWENGTLASSGQSFFVHDGCEVMRPENAETVPYNDPWYGQNDYYGGVANGESLVFYANGLGLMARNKVFNDTPAGFYEAIRTSGGRFGYGWRAYFQTDANDAGLNERAVDPTVQGPERHTRTLQRKRSYFWNVIGDFTLKIRY